jgi:DNA invertase Pin-like site-specific DNA recombinase
MAAKLRKKEGSMARPKRVQETNLKPRTIGYLRVSTEEQSLEKDIAVILSHANDLGLVPVQWIQEKISGKVPFRNRQLGTIVEELKKGDNLIVTELSRLGRSMLDVMECLSTIKRKGINVYAVKGNWSLNGMQSELLAMVFAMASQIERELISARTKAGLARVKASGKKLGRKPGTFKSKLDKWAPEIVALLKNGSTQAFIAKRYGCTNALLTNWIRRNKIDKTPNYARPDDSHAAKGKKTKIHSYELIPQKRGKCGGVL